MITYINGAFVQEEKAMLQVGDLALQRGYGAFDYFRTKNGAPLFLDDYLDRLFHSAEQLHLRAPLSKKDLKEIVFELIKRNELPQSGIRILLTGGYAPDSYSPAAPNLVLVEQPLELPSVEKFNTGVKVITHEYMRDLPAVKSINYLMGIWLQQKVQQQQAADVLYYTQKGITELPRANIFVITKDGTLVTPGKNVLKGITRMKLLQLAQDRYKVEERPLQLNEVKEAAEVFMTSTTKRILPINQVDDQVIGNGKAGAVTTELNRLFIQMEEQVFAAPQTV